MSDMLRFVFLLVAFFSSVVDGYKIFPDFTFQSLESSEDACNDFLRLYYENLENQTEWAVRMWESSARQPSGWISGQISQFGNYDECVKTVAPMPLKFCLTQLKMMLPNEQIIPNTSVWHHVKNPPKDGYNMDRKSVWMGVCIPKSCNPNLDPSDVVNPYNVTWGLSVLDPFCTDADETLPVDWGTILFIVFISVLALLACVATIYDKPDLKGPKLFINSFSLKRNLRTLIAPISDTQNAVAIAHGMKVLAISFIIYQHRFAVRYTMSSLSHEDYERNSRDPIFQYTAQFDTAVDVFFFMSGLLLSYVGVPKHANPIALILTRIFRLTPVHMFAVWVNASLVPHLGSGPLWKAMQLPASQVCAKNWWLNLLFVQNYVKSDKMCNIHTWYVSCDFHCFLAGLMLLTVLKWNRRAGITLTAIATVTALIIPGVQSYLMNYEPFFRFYHPKFLTDPTGFKSFRDYYIKSHNRIAIYLVGLICGLYFSSTKNIANKSRSKMSVLYMILAVMLMMTPPFYGVTIDAENIGVMDAVYASLRRPIWGLGLFCLLLSNKAHPLALVQPMLTCRMVAVLSRLSYGVFIFHFLIIWAEFAAMRSTAFFSYYDVLNSSLGVYSVIFAFLSYMFLEQPIKLFLTGLCFPKSSTKATETDDVTLSGTISISL